jgi:hypothetical protein
MSRLRPVVTHWKSKQGVIANPRCLEKIAFAQYVM